MEMILFGLFCAATVAIPSAREIRGVAPVLAVDSEPNAKLIVDPPPLPAPLSRGLVVMQYRTENLHIAPVFGVNALDVSPRIGHIHVTVDDASWHWLDASGEAIVINGFKSGKHKILIELVDANHKRLDGTTVQFDIP